MKKTIMATLLFVALSFAAFAGGKDKDLLNDLNAALKSSKQVTWSYSEAHNRAAFSFNGQSVVAYYENGSNDFLGFCVHIKATDLPAESQNALAKKYADWNIAEATMFIDAVGATSYFVRAQKDKKDLALKLNGDRISIFSHM